MTRNFDLYVSTLLEGLESQGNGSLARRAPGIQNNSSSSSVQGGVQPKAQSGVSMKFSGSNNPTGKQQVVINDVPENEKLLNDTLDNAMTTGNSEVAMNILSQKLQKDPNYFASDEMMKSPVRSKWLSDPNNQQLIAQLTTGIKK